MQTPQRMPDPTPEEIAAACAEIRRTWSEVEYYQRSVGAPDARAIARSRFRPQRWRPPTINANDELAGLLEAS